MMWVDYYINEINHHEVEVNGLKAECMACEYQEYAPTMDDAYVLKEIHEASRGGSLVG